jgi:predicted RNA-binding protein (virulence factor B family)
MITAGETYHLKVVKKVAFGFYLDADGIEILLPKRFAPKNLSPGDLLEVFVYHDSENRLIATTQKPKGKLGDIVALEVVSVTREGAFLDWGLMKDLFLPASQQLIKALKGQRIPVMIYLDKQTGRVAATEKFSHLLFNESLDLKEMEEVKLFVYRKTELGYEVIVNNKHIGLIHYEDIFIPIEIGDKLKGFVKKIRADKKLDIMPGIAGYARVGPEADRILQLLDENQGYLPFNDKSEPEKIQDFFGMSKKTFKMAIGALYKKRLIEFAKQGIIKAGDKK